MTSDQPRKPKLSVVTVCHNAEKTIEDTFRSVREQVYPELEYIVVDGASQDGTRDLIVANEDVIDSWVSEPDAGIYDAMNKGIRLASGDYVGFLNSDDFFATPRSVEAIARTLHHSQADATHGNCLIVDPADPRKILRSYSSQSFRTWHMRFGNMPPHNTIYVRRDLLLLAGGFSQELKIAADFDLLLRLCLRKSLDFAYIPGILTINRHGGISTRGFQSTLTINREIASSLRRNHVATHPVLLWSRYALKVGQYVAARTASNDLS